ERRFKRRRSMPHCRREITLVLLHVKTSVLVLTLCKTLVVHWVAVELCRKAVVRQLSGIIRVELSEIVRMGLSGVILVALIKTSFASWPGLRNLVNRFELSSGHHLGGV